MSSPEPRRKAKSAIDLLEEAVALLRAAPASALVAYYAGAVPFWLGLLYFVSDMSQSAFATQRLVSGSLGVTLLFIWMKCWHVFFASQLRGMMFKGAEQAWTLRRVMRVVVQQASIQPWGLVLRPLAVIVSSPFLLLAMFVRDVSVPFVMMAALFQNAVVLGDTNPDPDGRSLLSRGWRQAQLWPGQAYAIVSLLLVFGILVWLNVMSFFFAVPWLLNTFFDIETEASRNSGVLLNSTGLAAAFALTMLFLDPILKAVYVLRCFYGESLHTAQDLRAQLQRARKTIVTVTIGVFMIFSPATSGFAASTPTASEAVDSAELNRSIEEVLQKREYTWRSAPDHTSGAGKKSSWIRDVGKWVVEKVLYVRAKLQEFKEWLFPKKPEPEMEASEGRPLPVREIAYALLAVSLLIGAWGLFRRLRQKPAQVIDAQTLPTLPDLLSEDVAADQLPEDGWLELMRKSLADGQRRLALRAAYLASLAHLGQRELLTIARHKSNREYRRELQRRARSREALLAAFGENMEAFERAWYGDHEVSDTVLADFTRNLETIRAC